MADFIREPPTSITKVIIQLFRRFSNNDGFPKSRFHYMLWGYYDGMRYGIAKTFKEFVGVDKTDDREDNFREYETSRICLFSHSIAEKDVKDFFNNSKLPPLLVITELKIDEGNYHKNKENLEGSLNDLQTYISSSIDEFIRKEKLTNNEIEWKLFRSLGYSEFVIVFRSLSYQYVANIINYLRGLSYSKNLDYIRNNHLLRSTYSTAGIQTKNMNSLPPHPMDVSVRFSFKKIINLQEMQAKLVEALKIDNDKIQCNLVFGKYDLDVHFRGVPLNLFVGLFYDLGKGFPNPILDPDGNLRRIYIGRTNTHWLLNTSDDFEDNNPVIPNIKKNVIKLPAQGIDPLSIHIAFDQLIRSFYQVSRDDASELLLVYELEEIIRVFSKQVDENYIGIRKQIEKGYPDDREEFVDHYKSVEIGLNLIFKLLQSRVQAFRFFSEMPTFNLQFMRSTTKIFVMYMTIIEEFEKIINITREKSKPEDDDPQKINLFAVLDYAKVSSEDLFPETTERLIPIVLNIETISEIPYSIFLLIHEISHYIQTPNRIYRNRTLAKMFCQFLAQRILLRLFTGEDNLEIKNFEFKDKNLVLLRFQKVLFLYFLNDLWLHGEVIQKNGSIRRFPGSLINEFERNYSFLDDDVISNINSLYSDKVFIDRIDDPEEILRNLFNVLENSWQKISTGEDLSNLNGLWLWLLKQASKSSNGTKPVITLSDYDRLNNRWSEMLESVKNRKEKLLKSAMKFIDERWFNLIDEVISTIKSDVAPNIRLLTHIAKCRMNENTEANHRVIAETILLFLNSPEFKNSVTDTLTKYTDLFIEARADYFMCKFLGLTLGQYEEWINTHKQRMQHIMDQDDLNELDIRKSVLCNTELFQGHCENLNPAEEEIIKGIPLEDISNYLNELDSEKFFIQFENNLILQYLQRYFAKIKNPGELDEEEYYASIDIELIEYIWNFGIHNSRGVSHNDI